MNRAQLKALAIEMSLAMPPSHCAVCEGELYPALDRRATERNMRVSQMRTAIENAGKDVHDPDGEMFLTIARKIKAASKLLGRMPFGRTEIDHKQLEPASKREFMTLLGEVEEIALRAIQIRLGIEEKSHA